MTTDPGADEAVDTLEAFVIAYAAWERTGAQLALAAHQLAVSGTWAADGSASMSAWLRSACRMRPSDAQALLRRGRFLSEMPALATAIDEAAISVGQFDALTGATSAATRPLLIEQHAEIATAIAPLTITQTATYAAVWQR